MVKFASDVLNQRKLITLNAQEKLTYSQLVQVGSSAGGARAKALIAWNEKTNEIRSGQLILDEDYDYWLMKFDNVAKNGDHGLEDVPEYTLIEYAYYKNGIDAGILMSDCRIYSNAGENHFMTKRFDRTQGKKCTCSRLERWHILVIKSQDYVVMKWQRVYAWKSIYQ